MVTNAEPFCPVWESCLIGLLAKVSMEGDVAKSLLCIEPKSPRTVADFFPLDNGPAIVRSIQRIFGATPPASATHPGPRRHKAPTARASRDPQTQRADRELCAFISGLAAFVGGVPLTRAMIPWAMPGIEGSP